MLKNILTYSVLALSLFTWSQKSNKAPIYFHLQIVPSVK